MSINKVMLSGRLTHDAELRELPSGSKVLNFSIAVNDRRRNRDGQWEDCASFFNCALFGRRADSLGQYLTKGTKIAIDGKLNYRSWTDRTDGKKRSAVSVNVDELEFMSYGQQGGSGNRRNSAPRNNVQNAPDAQEALQQAGFDGATVTEIPTAPPPAAYNDSDIPF